MKSEERNTQTCNAEFVAWLNSTSFSGIVSVGDQWDTEAAWPSVDSMRAARSCFSLFVQGKVSEAEQAMREAQRSFV